MNTQECANLVERIIQTWPNGPRGRIWTEALTDLEPARATTTYTRLRDELEQPPTIGRFINTYRSLDPTRNTNQPSYDYEAISFTEYISRLRTRADRGEQAAITELDTWARWVTR